MMRADWYAQTSLQVRIRVRNGVARRRRERGCDMRIGEKLGWRNLGAKNDAST
jgi:hypothetical protein